MCYFFDDGIHVMQQVEVLFGELAVADLGGEVVVA